MDKISQALTALMLLGLALMMAPNILRMNKGKTLRNVALWLAIFAGLGLIYQLFGPGGKGLNFSSLMTPGHEEAAPAGSIKNTGDQGYTPPKE
jgi:hypothetical protein